MDSHRRARKLQKAIQHVGMMEPLEDRRLLTSLAGGGVDLTDPDNPVLLIGDQFIYKDAAAQAIRITLAGDIEAEFIGIQVSDMGVVTLTDLAPFSDTGTEQTDLYAVYVSHAT